MMFRVAIAGASGYVGGELIRLLANHPQVQLGALTADTNAGVRLAEVHPHLSHLGDHVLAATTPEAFTDHDVVFLALPHGHSAQLARQLHPDILVIDCGADHRLVDPHNWQRWYTGDYAGSWPYGLPELPRQREKLLGTRRIAGPGCFPTAVALAIMPAVVASFIDPEIVVVAATGTSGAGKALKPHLTSAEVMGSVSTYGVGGTHRHTPEIHQILTQLTDMPVTVSFTPMLVPMTRGILATVSAPILPGKAEKIGEIYRAAYVREPFIHLLPPDSWPTTAATLGANTAHIQVTVDPDANRLIAVAAIDNLTKGSAGGAIQAMNVALEIPETLGLPTIGVAP